MSISIMLEEKRTWHFNTKPINWFKVDHNLPDYYKCNGTGKPQFGTSTKPFEWREKDKSVQILFILKKVKIFWQSLARESLFMFQKVAGMELTKMF